MSDGSRPLISIITGIYNGEKYLSECIQSVVNQDYKNLEMILIDDGSEDNSGRIADGFARDDKRIKVVHQRHSGVSQSRNTALGMAAGDYICILDQDDVLSEDYVSYLYHLCKENHAEIALTPKADIFFGKVHTTGTDDNVQVWTGEQAAIEMLYHKIIIAPWNKMISRELIVHNKLKFHPNYFNGEGFAFSVECYQRAGRIAVGARKVYHYRVGDPGSGASRFKEEYIQSSICAQQYIKDTFVIETPQLLKSWEFSNWHTHCDCLNVMVGCGVADKYPELYQSIRQECKQNAVRAWRAPVSFQQKLRGIMYMVSPFAAAKIINHFRMRKFAKE